MSKSLGNGIDPLEVVERYGADALRYTLVSGHVGRAPTSSSIPTTSRARSRRAATSPTSCGTPAASSCPISTGPPGRSPDAHPTSVRPRRAHAGRPLDHRALRRDGRARPPRPTSGSGSTRPPARSTGSSGATWPTGTSSRSSRGSTATSPAATSPGRWWPRPSTWRSGCCIRSCRSSPRRSGGASPAGPTTPRSRWRPGRGRTARAQDADALARVRAGAGAGRRHPRHPRRVRRAAGPGGARRGDRQRRATSAALRAGARHHRPAGQALRTLASARASERVGGHAVLSDGTPCSCRWATPSTSAASASGSARRWTGCAGWSSRRRRSSATSSSSPARPRTWWTRERQKLDYLEGAARGAGAEAGAAGVCVRRAEKSRGSEGCSRRGSWHRLLCAMRPSALLPLSPLPSVLRPHRAAAGRPAGSRSAPARSPPGPTRSPCCPTSRATSSSVRRGDLRGRPAQPGRGHRRPGEAGHSVAHQPSPRRSWRRNRITVRPARGLAAQPGLPGRAASRRDRPRRTTGAERRGADLHAPAPRAHRPRSRARWWTGPPAGPPPGALVERRLFCPTACPTAALADSSGRFSSGRCRAASTSCSGVLDQNRNLRHDPREAFDTRARARRQVRGRRALGLRARHHCRPASRPSPSIDSVSATVTFAQKLDPRSGSTRATSPLRMLPDSTPGAGRALLPAGSVSSVARAGATPWSGTPPADKTPSRRRPTRLAPAGARPPDRPRAAAHRPSCRPAARAERPPRCSGRSALDARRSICARDPRGRNVSGVAATPRRVVDSGGRSGRPRQAGAATPRAWPTRLPKRRQPAPARPPNPRAGRIRAR